MSMSKRLDTRTRLTFVLPLGWVSAQHVSSLLIFRLVVFKPDAFIFFWYKSFSERASVSAWGAVGVSFHHSFFLFLV